MNQATTLSPTELNPAIGPPPRAARIPHRTTVHGHERIDYYHWLRDPDYPEVHDPDVLAYLREENEYHSAALEPHRALLERLYDELRSRIADEDESVPVRDGRWEFKWRYEKGAEYRTHLRRPAAGGEWEILLDERELAVDHDYFRLGGMDVSDDEILAYSIDTSGEERFTMRFRSLDGSADPEERIEKTIGAPVWLPGQRVVLYLELSDEWRPWRVKAHTVGTPVVDDRILYEEPDAGFFVDVDLTQDRRYVVITTGDHETSEVRLMTATDPSARPRLVSPRRRGHSYSVDHAHDSFYILTNSNAVNFRLVRAPEWAPGEEHWVEIVPERPDAYLRDFTPFSSWIALEERTDAVDQIRILTYDGAMTTIPLPEAVSSAHLGPNPEFDVASVRLHYQSMITPPTVFDYEPGLGTLTTRKVEQIPAGYDPTRYRTDRRYATAGDGARIPVSIVYRDDLSKDGTAPLHLYAYGAYGYGTPPTFSRHQLSLLDRGFVFAIAHVRGGDDCGYQWYLDGKLDKRVNTFNDFVDVARLLIEQRYTSAGRICVTGGSAGGELIGVVLNEAPELWGAAIAHVPFVDVTNTMLDDTLPLTPMEWPEWGNPVTDPEAYRTIAAYSPYDNVRPQAYPPTLVTAGLNDPRVTYWEPAKWTALLRHERTDGNVLLLKTNMGAGHAGRSGRFEHLRETAEEIAFMLLATGTATS